MNLYIETQDGRPVNHPAFEDNLVQAFGSIPTHWEPFNRVECPVLSAYKVFEPNMPTYQKVGDAWTDVWSARDMTAQEKSDKQQAVRSAFNAREQAENWASWTLDEATCTMIPPIPCPEFDQAKFERRIMTLWCGADGNWKDTPVCPDGSYKFDFTAWQWVEAAN